MITTHALSILSCTLRFCLALRGLYFPCFGAVAFCSSSVRYSSSVSNTTGRPCDMSSSDEAPLSNTQFVVAPFFANGPGVLVHFEGGGRVMNNVAFRHHMRLTHNHLIVNGCLMAQWAEGENVVCQVKLPNDDFMETSSE